MLELCKSCRAHNGLGPDVRNLALCAEVTSDGDDPEAMLFLPHHQVRSSWFFCKSLQLLHSVASLTGSLQRADWAR